MTGPLGRGALGADHARAREVAADRLDASVPAADAAWLEAHLARCPACAVVAAEYADQRRLLQALRLEAPEPPRDLWARTAAALESEAAHGHRPRRGLRWSLAPLVGMLVVVVALGAELLGGAALLPRESTTGGDGAMPTPITMAVTEVQVLGRGDDGTVQLLTRRLDEVCPVGTDACGITPTFDVAGTTTFTAAASLDAILSPSRDRMVVVERGAGSRGVYVLQVSATATATPGPSSQPTSTATPPGPVTSAGPDGPTATPTIPPTVVSPAPVTTDQPVGSPTPATSSPTPATPTPVTPATEPPTAPPVVSPTPAWSPTPSPSGAIAPTPPPSVAVTSTAGPAASSPATATVWPSLEVPSPSVTASPLPEGTVEIARDVVVVGSAAAYAPDGLRFAFTARPSDGSVGPDVFLWTVGEAQANPVTTDHGSVFAGWLDGKLLVSHVTDGQPSTALLDPVAGTEVPVGPASVWRPAVGPGQRTAIWWDGTLTLAPDGVTTAPHEGRLVLGQWPDGGPDPQALVSGPLTDWDVHWDDAGSVVAVWTSTGGPGEPGRLSLYTTNPGDGRADLAHPVLDAAPAYAGYSLQPGRLAWCAPAEAGGTTVQVLAWSGTSVGRLELPTQEGVTVVR